MAQTSASPTATSSAQLLKPAELDQLVAPIALYPDPLLAQVLMASAYPLDIVQAERWLEANKNLKGEALKAAVDKQPWDDSIKSLVATPDVLQLMSSKLDWTQKLGDAVVAQQADVMDAIQRLRTKAQANNKLQSTKEQKVTVQQVQNRQVIAIEPTDPDMVYVPYYDPGVVYGDWPYPDYPPDYWPTPGYIGAGIIAAGIGFGAGYALGRWHGGNYWGGGVNWNNNNINVRPGGGGAGTAWRPRVDHRQGAGNRGNRPQQLNFRGSGGQQVIKPGGAGNRGNAGQNRPANRPSAGAGNRPTPERVRQAAVSAIAPRNDRAAEGRTPALPIAVVVVVVVAPALFIAAAGVALPCTREAVVVAACAAVVVAACAGAAAVVAAVADAGPTSCSSTTSRCSATSTMASAFIASATTAATRPMSASWPRRCSRSCRKRSRAAATAICVCTTTSSV